MRTGQIEANVLRLNEAFRLPYIPDLVACKLEGSEQVALGDEVSFYQGEYERLSRDSNWPMRKADYPLLEEGCHDQLMAQAGDYAHLYRLQAELYRNEAMRG